MIQSGSFQYTEMEEVVFGRPAEQAIADQAEKRGAQRVFLIASGTLNRETDEIARVVSALGERYAGLYDSMPSHTPRDAVLAASGAAREAGADLLVTFGGGSVTDGGKIVQICLRHNLTRVEDLDGYHRVTREDGTTRDPSFDGPKVRQVTVPTTLSGGEFNPSAGCTDHRIKVKQGYRHPLMVPMAVILDPAPTVHTPEWLWLSTGIRAVDHAVEAICSPLANPYCDGAAIHALRLLGENLPRVKADPGNLEARLNCQIGAWLSMTAVIGGVPMGASHAIGHILGGTCDVPHGYTSCIMLPAVLRWNVSINRDRQKLVAEAMGKPGIEASDVLHEFISGLGMPRTLGEVGVEKDQFERVAQNTMHDRWIYTNPRKIDGPANVIEILNLAA
jgi:maleylacetate reductase